MATMSRDYMRSLGKIDESNEGKGALPNLAAATSHKIRRLPAAFLSTCSTSGKSQIVAVCSDPGMGRTTLLREAMSMFSGRGDHTRYEDCVHSDIEESFRRLADVAKWCRKERESGFAVAVAIDNLPVGDECDAERMARLIRSMTSAGASVFVSLLPEGEILVEMLGEACCFWACNLTLPLPGSAREAILYSELTRGIPALVEPLSRMLEPSVDTAMSDPAFQQAYVEVIGSSFRSGMMLEELRTRAVMMLMGSGAFVEVEDVVGRVDPDLWRSIARDAPVFGVDAAAESFCCVGSSSRDGLNVIYSCMAEVVAGWPEIVASVAQRLVARGEYQRAAAVIGMCSSESMQYSVVLEWAPEFINAGEVVLVRGVLDEAADGHYAKEHGFVEARWVMAALTMPLRFRDGLGRLPADGRRATYAMLAMRCREVLRGAAWEVDASCLAVSDPLVESLVLCGRAMAYMVSGSFEDAFMLLVDAPARTKNVTVVSTVLQMEYVLCSLLMGIVPPNEDYELLNRSTDLLDRAGLSALAGIQESIVPLGMLLGGRNLAVGTFEAHVHKVTRMGDVALQGMYLIASAILDVRAHAFVRAHVRLGQAISALDIAGLRYMSKVAHMLDVCVRIQLSERVPRSEISLDKGATASLDKVVVILLAATSSKRSKRAVGAGHWNIRVCPRDIHWIMNILMGDFGNLSKQVRRVCPDLWRESVDRDAAIIDSSDEVALRGRETHSTLEKPLPSESSTSTNQPTSASEGQNEKRVRINVLGGLEVRADGVAVGGNALERRRAKSMLALLAAIPGHVAKRFTIMESVWPEYDYETAHRCVYSATSVLRTEICEALGDVNGEQVVFSNRSDRTVLLNKDLVRCDVDEFEEKAHRVLDGDGNESVQVALCREIEDLYRGPLFVPPTDGAGIVGGRARELQALYCDAMIAGAYAAMRTDTKMLACRFAKKAHEADDMREDALRVLLATLCNAGRRVEAEQAYEQYVSHVVDVTRRPPSRDLRRAASQLLGEETREPLSKRRAAPAQDMQQDAEVVDLSNDVTPRQLMIDLGDGMPEAQAS